jgi:xanthosine utilization system XapX-like protein
VALPPVEWSVVRPAPPAMRWALGLVLVLGSLLGPTLLIDRARSLADEWTPHLGELAPPQAGIGLSVGLAVVGLLGMVLGGATAWYRRRWGGCGRRGDALVFYLDPHITAQGLLVLREDVTSWELGRHGVLVRARRHTPIPADQPGRPRSRGLLAELLSPLLVPTTDPAEVARLDAFLARRETP